MIEIRLSQSSKALFPILVTPLGILYSVALQAGAKAISVLSTIREQPLSAADLPLNSSILTQPENASSSIDVTLSGITIDVRLVQC